MRVHPIALAGECNPWDGSSSAMVSKSKIRRLTWYRAGSGDPAEILEERSSMVAERKKKEVGGKMANMHRAVDVYEGLTGSAALKRKGLPG